MTGGRTAQGSWESLGVNKHHQHPVPSPFCSEIKVQGVRPSWYGLGQVRDLTLTDGQILWREWVHLSHSGLLLLKKGDSCWVGKNRRGPVALMLSGTTVGPGAETVT
jgi:hypothetical protein